MAIVTFNNETFSCTTAIKGPDYIYLLDADGDITVAFEGIADFSGFYITDGEWVTPTPESECYVAVIKEDGVIGSSGHRCSEFLTALPSYLEEDNVPQLDGNQKVLATQSSAAILSQTSSFTLTAGMAGKFIRVNSSSAVKITIPANDALFPVGTEMEFLREGSGSVTFAAASGVKLVSFGSATSIVGTYAVAALKKIAANRWLLAGGVG